MDGGTVHPSFQGDKFEKFRNMKTVSRLQSYNCLEQKKLSLWWGKEGSN